MEQHQHAGYDFEQCEPDEAGFGLHWLRGDVAWSKLPYQSDRYFCCICLSGSTSWLFDLQHHELHPNEMAITIPGEFVQHQAMSADFEGILFVSTLEFVKSMNLPFRFDAFMGFRAHPVVRLDERQKRDMLYLYQAISRLCEERHPRRQEIVRHMICAYFYYGYSFVSPETTSASTPRDAELLQRFLELVKRHYATERRVAFYAGQLAVTPGYLSTIIKRISGRAASDWIDAFVITEAKILLQRQDITAQQVSQRLNFPSQSFFGKFFRRKTGMSPIEYRGSVR